MHQPVWVAWTQHHIVLQPISVQAEPPRKTQSQQCSTSCGRMLQSIGIKGAVVAQVRRQVLGEDAPPLLVIGPRPLRRALHAYAQLEPLTFVYLDNAHTLVRAVCICSSSGPGYYG